MNKVKFLIILSSILFVSNILTIGFLLFNRFKPHGPRNIIIQKLDFDAKQIEKYDEIIKVHRKEIVIQDSILQNLRTKYYVQLNEKNENQETVLNEIGKQVQLIEKIHLAHFEQIKKICNPNQLEKFNTLLTEMSKLFSKNPRKGEPK